MVKNFVPELLAPAGSMLALKAAVNAGADAVYLSGKRFGARHFATNFSDSEIEEGIKYAKLRGVHVYITVNTLVNDSQMESVAKYIIWLYKIGADSVIIQDLGVAGLSRKIVPDLDIHASTQMTLHNTAGVKWASRFGFKRVVLSRELDIYEVEDIKNKTAKKGIEVEIFAHGALCYSYSGQCLLSSFIGGRSGNRGMCAQPCRKKYQMFAGKTDKYGRPLDPHQLNLYDEYILSTRDLAVYNNLDKISGIGVDSIKIEGRMRSPEYVATVVRVYRKALDLISRGNWKPNFDDISKLKLAFNRGFTGGYLTGKDPINVMGREAPGNRGLYMGYVMNYNPKNRNMYVKLENRFKLGKGDGIVFISSDKGERDKYENYGQTKGSKDYKYSDGSSGEFGMALEKIPEIKGDKLILKVLKPIKPGSKMYLTRSITLNHSAADIIKKNTSPSIPMDLVMKWDKELEVHLYGKFTGFDGFKHKIHYKSDFKMEKAIKKPLQISQIKDQLKKTGKTPFILKKMVIEYPGDLFTPLSKLNQLRREFLEKSKEVLVSTLNPPKNKVQTAENRLKSLKLISLDKSAAQSYIEINNNLGLAVYTDSLEGIKGALDGGAKRIYFEAVPNNNYNPKILSSAPIIISHDLSENSDKTIDEQYKKGLLEFSSVLNDALRLCKDQNAEFIWKWPQITHQYEINHYLDVLNADLDNGIHEIMVDGLGAAHALINAEYPLILSGSAGLNIWNRCTVSMLSRVFNRITPSAELSRENLKTLISNSHLDGVKTPFELVVQGNVDTLISRDNLLSMVSENEIKNHLNKFWGIKDTKNHIFPIRVDNTGRSHILNSVELCLIDHLAEISEMGVDTIVVDARNKTYDYTTEMTSIYSNGLEYIEMGINTTKNLNQLKSKIKNISTGGITTGNFIKGVKGR